MTRGLDSPDDPATQAAGLTLGPAPVPLRRIALALLLTGKAQASAPAVDQFIQFAKQQHLGLDQLWLARRGDQPLASVLFMPSAGRTAIVFVSPAQSGEESQALTLLIRLACAAQDPANTRMVQALLEPEQVAQAQALGAADFKALATLIYMRRHPERPAPLQLPPELSVLHWSERNRPAFAQAILSTYRETLDCPGLVGLRHIDDIIAGHMATGRFVPELWFALWQDEQPAGVMLLNPVPQQHALELVYLGLAPPFRGRGLGGALVRHGLGLARAHELSSMMLAVDQDNTPAVKLYESLQFTPYTKKIALLYVARA